MVCTVRDDSFRAALLRVATVVEVFVVHRFVLLAAVMLFVSGCLSVSYQVDVAGDGSFQLSTVVELPEKLAADVVAGSPDRLCDALLTDGGVELAAVDAVVDDGVLRVSCVSQSGLVADQFDMFDVVVVNGRVSFDAVLPPTDAAAGFAADRGLGPSDRLPPAVEGLGSVERGVDELVQVSFAVSGPGRVVEHNGVLLDDATVVWHLPGVPTGDELAVTVSAVWDRGSPSNADDGSLLGVLLLLLLAAVLVPVAVVAGRHAHRTGDVGEVSSTSSRGSQPQ